MAISDHIRHLRQKVGSDLLHIPSVTILTFDEQGRVLLVRDSGSGAWTTPGGSIELGEYPADAAIREMCEETGAQVELTRLMGVYGGSDFIVTYGNGDRTSYLMSVFAAQIKGGELQPDGAEVSELRYFSQADLAKLELTAWQQRVLGDAFSQQTPTHFQPPTWQPPTDGIRPGGMSEYTRQIRAKVGHDLMMQPTVGVIVLNEVGEVLLQKRSDNGRWAPPAGAIEPDESPTDAAVRETWEETGVLVEPLRLTGIYTGPDYFITFSDSGDQIVAYSVIFLCRAIGGEAKPDGLESADVAYFAPEVLAGDFLSPRWRFRLGHVWDGRASAYFNPPTQ
jgi:8-oxo-dGTP pyrophosphatase MutT (NUDIX family)